MKRRRVLATVASVSLAGCSGARTGDPAGETATTTATPSTSARPTTEPTPTPEPTTTTEPTPTTTPEPRAPTVEAVNLVTEWVDYGDVVENEIEGEAPGAGIVVGYRYDVEVHDGLHHITRQCRVYDSDGQRVAFDASEDRQLVEYSGYDSWEGSIYFETDGWALGEYEAEVLVRDEVSGKNSNAATGRFAMNSRLRDDEARLVSYDGPETVAPNEEYEYRLTFENRANRDSGIVSPVSTRLDGSDWYVVDEFTFAHTLPAGETRTWESGQVTAASEPGTYGFRIDDIGATWEVTVQ